MLTFITNECSLQTIEIVFDNQKASKMARNDSSSTRTKQIDIQYHLVSEKRVKNLFNIDYCSTTDMAADILTKPLFCILLEKHKNNLGLEMLSTFDGIGLRGSAEYK